MEREDFDCQKCGRNIGNYWDVSYPYYQCPEENVKYLLVEKAKPFFLIQTKTMKVIWGKTPDDKVMEAVFESIKKEKNKHGEKGLCVCGLSASFSVNYGWSIDIIPVTWELSADGSFDELLKQAGGIPHKIKGSGWGRHGYCFCLDCAKKLKYKCDTCNSELYLVERTKDE